MANVAKVSTMQHLRSRRQVIPFEQAGCSNLLASALYCLTSNSTACILSSKPLKEITIGRRLIGTLRKREFSSSLTRRLAARAPPVLAIGSQKASTPSVVVQEVEFTWKGQCSEVLLTGDFLNWDKKVALEKISKGVFSLKQKLALGRYSYKFIVDGEWKHSSDSPTVPDGIGGFNNEVVVADETTVKDLQNATKAQSPRPTNNVKPAAKTKPAEESGSGVAVQYPKASAEERGSGVPVQSFVASAERPLRAVPKKVVAASLEGVMSNSVIPLLSNVLRKENGITDVDVTFEDNQLKTSFAKGDIPYCFWAFFPDGILEGSRGSSLTSHGSPPSTIEPFLVDEKKVTPELLVFWIKKRLFAQKILSMN